MCWEGQLPAPADFKALTSGVGRLRAPAAMHSPSAATQPPGVTGRGGGEPTAGCPNKLMRAQPATGDAVAVVAPSAPPAGLLKLALLGAKLLMPAAARVPAASRSWLGPARKLLLKGLMGLPAPMLKAGAAGAARDAIGRAAVRLLLLSMLVRACMTSWTVGAVLGRSRAAVASLAVSDTSWARIQASIVASCHRSHNKHTMCRVKC